MNITEKATLLALRAHEGQMRKDAPIPYVVHPLRVGLILARYGFDDEVVAAGIVHDVVEDTSVSIEEVEETLGVRVAGIVAPVTHDDTLSWKEKKQAYIDTVRMAHDDAKAVATADKIANAESLVFAHEREGSEVWRHFNAGREQKLWFERAMLTMLEESWDHPLVAVYRSWVEKLETLV